MAEVKSIHRTEVSDLPILNDLAEPNWGRDMRSFSEDIFAREYQGLNRAPDGSVVAYRNEDLRALMADRSVCNVPVDEMVAYMSEKLDGGAEAWRAYLDVNPFTMQSPLHGPGRQVFTRQLSRGKVTSFATLVDEIIDEIAREQTGSGEFDFQNDFAGRVTARFWGRLLGLTPEEEEISRRAADGMVLGFQFDLTRTEAEEANAAAGEYMRVLGGAIMRGVAAEDNQMLSEMSTEFDSIDLPGKPANVGEMLASVLFDGIHTAKAAITNVVYAFLENPAAREQVEADLSLIGAATQEGMRLYAPVTATLRYTAAEVVYDGVTIPAGTVLLMAWCVGNRDPAAFSDPSSFRMDRKARDSMTFGGGFQICPGRHVGSMLAESVVRGWSEGRFQIDLREAGGWHPGSAIGYQDYLKVTVS